MKRRLIRSRSAALLAALSAIAICACVAESAPRIPDPAADLAGLLPAPQSLRQASGSVTGRFRYGAMFEAALPQQRTEAAANASALYSPQLSSAPQFEDLAFAIYALDSSGFEPPEQLWLEWFQSADFGHLWIGLADFSANRWDWYPGPAWGYLALDGEKYFGQGLGYAVVLCSGQSPWRLKSIRILPGTPPQISSAAPESGTAGASLAASCINGGGAADSFSWDFGGGASPNTSTLQAPEIELGAAGTYNCTLTLANAAGTDDYAWQLVISTAPAFSASGRVFDLDGTSPLAGCTLHLSGDGSGQTQTDGGGNYSFDNLADGAYHVAPTGAKFAPSSRDFSIAGADAGGLDFVKTGEQTYAILGSVIDDNTHAGVAGIHMHLSGDATADVDSEQFAYGFMELLPGHYYITAECPYPGYYTGPPQREVWIVDKSVTNVNFLMQDHPVQLYSASGRITEQVGGAPVAGLAVGLDGFAYDSTTTDSEGYFTFSGLVTMSYGIRPDPAYEYFPAGRIGFFIEEADKTGLDMQRKP